MGSSKPPRSLPRRDWLVSGAAGLASLVLYLATGARDVRPMDAGEFALVFAVGGVAHPPGYALQTLLSVIGVHGLGFLTPAHAASVLAGVWSSLTVALLVHWLSRIGIGHTASVIGALALATGRTYWSQAISPEVYAFDLLLLLVVLHAGLGVARAPTRNAALFLGAATGCWLLHRPVNLLYVPALLVPMWPALRRSWRDRRLLLGAALGATLSLLPVAYLPIAAAYDPANAREELSSLADVLKYQSGTGFSHLLGLDATHAARRLGLLLLGLPSELGLALLALPFGVHALRRRGLTSLGGLLAFLLVNVGFALVYEIPDTEAYFLPSYLALAVLAAHGADALLAGARELELPVRRRIEALGVLAAAAGVFINLEANDVADERWTRRLAEEMLAAAPPESTLCVHGDTPMNALLYLQRVEQQRRDVLLVYCTIDRSSYWEQLRKLYPTEPWPGELLPMERRVATFVFRTLAHRPIAFSPELDPSVVLSLGTGGDAWRQQLRIARRGLLAEVVPLDPGDAATSERAAPGPEARAALERLAGLVERRPAPRLEDDVDERISYLEIAHALLESAAPFEVAGELALAQRAYRAVLGMYPDQQERAYVAEQEWRTGTAPRTLGIGDRARRALGRVHVKLVRAEQLGRGRVESRSGSAHAR